jgi:molybdopterin-guanine dinucleotide biosynthesis protein A
MNTTATVPCSAVILAGGLSSRFDGRDKALIEWNGRPLLDYIQNALRDRFRETLLVTNAPCRYAAWDMTLVTDLLAQRSSLTGIQAGLFYASQPYVFVTACDTPLLQPALIALLLDAVQNEVDVVIPKTDQGLEPLCALYSQRCLQLITHQLKRGDFRIRSFFQRAKVRHISETRLREADPDLRSFFNINTPQDLAEARRRFPAANGPTEPRENGEERS